MKALFGSGLLGLRSLATGLPIAFLANPRRALASGAVVGSPANPLAQYVIYSTSTLGDPVNANVPGMYGDPNISHPLDPSMAPTPMTLGGQSTTAAAPWAQLPQAVLDRSCFFHHGTYTVVHPDEHKVMSLMGATANQEMLVSLLAKQLAPALGTVQTEPVTIGAGASEAVTFDGRPQPLLSPTSLSSILTAPAGPLAKLQALRDSDLDRLNALARSEGNSAQRAFIDSYASSQMQARNISQNLISTLASLKDNSPSSQVIAAVALIQMNIAPVVTIHIPFGGDNHTDIGLANETAQTVAGVATIAQLMQQLTAAGLQDRVTFAMMNVFGRTLSAAKYTDGRTHLGNHHCTVLIGKPIRGSVIGGVEAGGGDYRAMSLDSTSGAGVPSGGGDVAFTSTLASLGQTLGTAVGADPTYLGQNIAGGKVIAPALANA